MHSVGPMQQHRADHLQPRIRAMTREMKSFSLSDVSASIDGQPRVADTTIAASLGFKKIYDIRELIARHVTSLMRFGGLPRRQEKSGGRGRPSQAYYLNKKQALYICTKSDTPNATEVTIQMVEVFDAYTSGKTIKVSEHNRRTSVKIDDAVRLKTNIDRLEAATRRVMAQSEKLCAVNIRGARLVVDLSDHTIHQGDYALIIDHRGEIDVQSFDDMQRDVGIRKATSNAVALRNGGASRDVVTVVGKVVSPYPEMDLKVLTIMASGPWNNAQIANATGSTIDHVRYVRQRVFEISRDAPRYAQIS